MSSNPTVSDLEFQIHFQVYSLGLLHIMPVFGIFDLEHGSLSHRNYFDADKCFQTLLVVLKQILFVLVQLQILCVTQHRGNCIIDE